MQPRNRFLVWFSMPYWELRLGDTFPQFSELILWGKQVRGVESHLAFGFFNLDVAYGETMRPIQADVRKGIMLDPVTGDTLYLDPTTGDTVTTPTGIYVYTDRIYRYGTYKQTLLALRPSFGSGRHFQLGFNFLKVKDNPQSINVGLSPQDNLVLGVDLGLAFLQRRMQLKAETAFSLLTTDISTGPMSKAEIDSVFDTSLPVDPAKFQKLIVLNASTIPPDPTKFSSVASAISFHLNYWNNYLSVKYKSIGSEYHSLGTTYLRNDIRGWFMWDQIRLLQNRLYLSLGYEDYWDHFSEKDNNPAVRLRTWRIGFNLLWGAQIPAITFNYRNYLRDNGIDAIENGVDLRENNTTEEYTLNLSYDFPILDKLDNTIQINWMQMDRKDAFRDSRLPQTIPIDLSGRVQIISWRSRYSIPLETYVSYSTNKNSYLGGLQTFRFDSWSLRGEYSFRQNRYQVYLGLNSFRGDGGSTTYRIDYTKTDLLLGAYFQFSAKQFLRVDFSYSWLNDRGGIIDPTTGVFTPNPDYRDLMFRIQYELRIE